MKVAYIAGPYRGKTHYDIEKNIRAAEEVAIKYWRLGFAVICPHKNTAHFDGLAPDDTWLLGDIEILKKCDIIVMMENYQQSEGAKIELETASKNGLEIIFDRAY